MRIHSHLADSTLNMKEQPPTEFIHLMQREWHWVPPQCLCTVPICLSVHVCMQHGACLMLCFQYFHLQQQPACNKSISDINKLCKINFYIMYYNMLLISSLVKLSCRTSICHFASTFHKQYFAPKNEQFHKTYLLYFPLKKDCAI